MVRILVKIKIRVSVRINVHNDILYFPSTLMFTYRNKSWDDSIDGFLDDVKTVTVVLA